MLKEEHSIILKELKESHEAATKDIVTRLENDHAGQLKSEKGQALAQIEMIDQARQKQISDLQVKKKREERETLKKLTTFFFFFFAEFASNTIA